MRIVHVTHYYLPHVGGIEFYVHRLAKAQLAAGHEVLVVSSTKSGAPVGRTDVDGVPVVYLPARTVLPRNPVLRGLVRTLHGARPDVVHVHSIWFLPSLQAVRVRRRLRFHTVNTVHGVAPDDATFVVASFLRLFAPVARFVLRRSDAVVVLTRSELKKLEARFPGVGPGAEVIPNGVDDAAADPAQVQLLRDRHGDAVVLFTGRIIPDKNPDLLIRSFVRVAEERPHLRLVFVGPVDDTYRAELLKLAGPWADRVTFRGALDPVADAAELRAWYSVARMSVCVGSWEGLPTRLLESLVAGTPVIAFASGGTASVLRSPDAGGLIDALDARDLAAQLARVDDRVRSHPELVEQASRNDARDWSWSASVASLGTTYARIMQEDEVADD